MERFSEIIDLKPAVLYKDDLFELETVIRTDLGRGNKDFTVSVESGLRRISAESIEELFTKKLPPKSSSIDISALSWQDEEINASINLRLNTNYIQLQLSSDSESLFYAKKRKY
jgi:hypothetical protein